MASVNEFADPSLILCRQLSPFTKTTVTIGNGCDMCCQQQGLRMNGLEAGECSHCEVRIGDICSTTKGAVLQCAVLIIQTSFT